MIYSIWTTTACNLNCVYCYEGSNKKFCNMDYRTARELIHYIQENTNPEEELVVNFHGGEPFINFEIIEFLVDEVEKMTGIKKTFSVTTNGTIIDDSILLFLKKHDFNVTLSIDGDKKTNDMSRVFKDGRGSYSVVKKNADRLLHEFNDSLRIRMTVTPENVEELFNNTLFLYRDGFRILVPGIDVFSNKWTEHKFNIYKREIVKIKKYFKDKRDVNISLLEPLNECGPFCLGGKENVQVHIDGTFYPCVHVVGNNKYKIGDLRTGIDKKKQNRVCNEINSINEECNSCDLLNYCTATRCKFKSFIVNGRYDVPTIVECSEVKLIYQLNGIEN